jgi:hypothetical protein
VDTGQVGWVVPHPLEILYAVITAHIPSDMVGVPHYDLGDCRSPTATADDCYFAAIEHLLLIVKMKHSGSGFRLHLLV